MPAEANTSLPFDAINGDARVATLLNGNDAPHDAERVQLRTSLKEARGFIAKYDEILELLLKDVNAIREERDALHCYAQEAQTILHPIRTLSDDVLHEIFAHCVPEWEDLKEKLIDEQYSSLNSRNAPWTLSHTCSRWRRVALSTPHLWSTIVFTFKFSRDKKGSRMLSRLCYNLGVSISRSGNTDLSVAMTTSDILPEMISVLLAVSAVRWRRLCLQAKGHEFPAALSGLYFERLQEAVLLDIQDTLDSNGNSLAPFLAAPRLRKIHDSADVYLTLPWSKITHYVYGISSIRSRTFLGMPNLTHLSLNVKTNAIEKQLAKLSFPTLLSLSLTLRSYAFFVALLPLLEVPALSNICLTYQLDSASNRKFVTFSLPKTDILPKQLTSFHIACHVRKFHDADAAILASWLRLATDLTVLSIHLPNIPETLLDDLHAHAQGDVLLPRLKSLDLWVLALDEDTQISASGVLSVLESRSGSQPNASRLEEFCTNVDAGRFSEGMLQRWQDICRKVKIICPR